MTLKPLLCGISVRKPFAKSSLLELQCINTLAGRNTKTIRASFDNKMDALIAIFYDERLLIFDLHDDATSLVDPRFRCTLARSSSQYCIVSGVFVQVTERWIVEACLIEEVCRGVHHHGQKS